MFTVTLAVSGTKAVSQQGSEHGTLIIEQFQSFDCEIAMIHTYYTYSIVCINYGPFTLDVD